jgi:transcriptional regulator with XRE-family HTH domain
MRNQLGDLLRKLRRHRSVREIAKETGYAHTLIHDFELGFRRGSNTPLRPSPAALKKLSEVYQYPYEELLKIAGYKRDVSGKKGDTELRMIMYGNPELSAQEKQILRNLMEEVFPDAF